MLNFGLSQGRSDETVCDTPNGELIQNWTFDCGSYRWSDVNTSSSYSNGTVDIIRNGSGSRVQQTIYLEAGDYTIEVEVVSTSGSGFVFMNPAGSAGNYPLDFLDPGVYTKTVTIDTSEDYNWGVGANNPIGSHTVFGYLSLKKTTGIEILDMDRDGNPDTMLYASDSMNVSEDIDSINIDTTGDKEANVVLPK